MMAATTTATTTSSFNSESLLATLSEPYKEIVQDVLKEKTTALQFDSLETKLRSTVLEKCSTLDLSAVQDAFEISVAICESLPLDGMPKLALVLLEDIVESMPLKLLQQFYQNAKPIQLVCHPNLWHKNRTKGSTAHVLQFIRVCNQLMKRLPPKSEWTGRILLELADRLPLTDKSSQKPWGSVAGNTVDYQDSNQYHGDDYTFYQTFWSLQNDFSNPYSVSFGTFVAKFQKVLTELEAYPTGGSVDSKSLQYLTHSRLLTAQLESSKSLKLHILTQFAITEAFLSTQSPQLQSALEPLKKRSWILLEKLDAHHSSLLENLLNDREIMWREWKKNKCLPPIQLPTATVPSASNNSSGTKADVNNVSSSSSSTLDDLHFLNPISMDELQDISSNIVSAMPSFEDHLEEYVQALDPEAGIEEEYSPKRDKVMGWQALRLLAHQHVKYFAHVLPNGDFENMVRHVFSKELGKEIPGDLLPDVQDEDDTEDEEEHMIDKDVPIDTEEEEAVTAEEEDITNSVDEEDVVPTTEEEGEKVVCDDVKDSTEEDHNVHGDQVELSEVEADIDGKSGDDNSQDADVTMDVDVLKDDTADEDDDAHGDDDDDDDEADTADENLDEEEEEEKETEEQREKRLAGMSEFDRANAEEEEELKRLDKEERAKKRKEEGRKRRLEARRRKREESARQAEETKRAMESSKKVEKSTDPGKDKHVVPTVKDPPAAPDQGKQVQDQGNKRKRTDDVANDSRKSGPTGNRGGQRGGAVGGENAREGPAPRGGPPRGSIAADYRHPPMRGSTAPSRRGGGGGGIGGARGPPPPDNRGDIRGPRGPPSHPQHLPGRGGAGPEDRRGGHDRRGGGGQYDGGRDTRRGPGGDGRDDRRGNGPPHEDDIGRRGRGNYSRRR